MAIFESVEQQAPSKKRRYVISAAVFLLLVAGFIWWMLRFHTEKTTVHHFMNALIAGNMQQAYKIWKPSASYTFQDFQEDWGSNGYYGPVKSFQIENTDRRAGASGVVIKIELSPYQPFPDDNDVAKRVKTKEVTLWVEFNDQSISYPPD